VLDTPYRKLVKEQTADESPSKTLLIDRTRKKGFHINFKKVSSWYQKEREKGREREKKRRVREMFELLAPGSTMKYHGH